MLSDGRIAEISRVHGGVAEEMVNLAVNFIRSGARGDVDDGSGVPAVLRAICRVIDFEFFNGVDGRLERNLILRHVAHLNAVDHEVDFVFASARRIERKGALASQGSRQDSIGRRRHGPRNQQREIYEVAAVEGYLLNGASMITVPTDTELPSTTGLAAWISIVVDVAPTFMLKSCVVVVPTATTKSFASTFAFPCRNLSLCKRLVEDSEWSTSRRCQFSMRDFRRSPGYSPLRLRWEVMRP